jgi:hypothetical protein
MRKNTLKENEPKRAKRMSMKEETEHRRAKITKVWTKHVRILYNGTMKTNREK